jgi:hypothetical protein
VVGDLEQVNPGQAALQENGIDALLDVAHQKHPAAVPFAKQDDRDVVDAGAGVGRLDRDGARVGPEHPEGDPVHLEPVPGREPPGGGAVPGEVGRPGGVTRAWTQHARFHDPPDPIALEENRQPGHVVFVGMGQDQQVDPPVPRRQPGIQRNQQAIRIRPPIDEHPAAAAAVNEDRIALPDIQNADVDLPVRAMLDEQNEGDDRHDHGHGGEAFHARARGEAQRERDGPRCNGRGPGSGLRWGA